MRNLARVYGMDQDGESGVFRGGLNEGFVELGWPWLLDKLR